MTLGCGSGEPNTSEIKTDLGTGNQDVVRRFDLYQNKINGCNGAGDGKRVLVTGFGLFAGASFNISGTVVKAMAARNFWPQRVDLSRAGFRSFRSSRLPGERLQKSEHGGRATQRSLIIDNQIYEVCYLLLEVTWDLAAAIIVHEARTFKPDLIMMTGRGGSQRETIFEAGAVNRATRYHGFSADGRANTANTPVSNEITDSSGTLNLSWNNRRLAAVTLPLVRRIWSGFSTTSPTRARSSNSYICNNVAYVVINALSGRTTKLAGGNLLVAPLDFRAKAGFMHFPTWAYDDAWEVFAWGRVVAKAFTSAL